MALTAPEVVRTWFREVWDKGRAEAINEYATADWVGQGMDLPGEPELPMRERFKLLHQIYRSAFPDVTISVDKTMCEGDMVAAHCTVRGTHTGPGLAFPPTGRPITFSGVVMVRCRDGKIAESWESWNFLSMYSQLGRTLA